MYQKVCNVVYQSTNGRMDAEIESNTLYVTPKKFSKDELTNIKKSVWKQIQDKVFINGKYADKQKSFGIGTTDEAFTEVFGSDNPDFDG